MYKELSNIQMIDSDIYSNLSTSEEEATATSTAKEKSFIEKTGNAINSFFKTDAGKQVGDTAKLLAADRAKQLLAGGNANLDAYNKYNASQNKPTTKKILFMEPITFGIVTALVITSIGLTIYFTSGKTK
jgi:hypothetical protein